jgi:hypothetical protein
MKKQLLALSTALITGVSFSQTIFSENFDAGLTLPAGWAQYNVDGLTPATNVNYMGTAGWVIRANTATGVGNNAVSTSWYTPAGTSNDWLVTPTIAVPASGTYTFQFDAMAPDANFSDGFKVYVSTAGNAVANFTAPAVLTQAAAANTYTTYSISLAAFAGQNINIGIQNNSNDMFLLFVDNAIARQPLADDAILMSSSLNRYSTVNTNNDLSLTVKNDGLNAITSLTVNWNDGTDHSSVISANIAPGATATITHPTAVSYATAVEKDIDITITNVNGNTDPNMANNTSGKLFNTVSQVPAKSVVFEEGTGTWCGWCPRGAVAMEFMENNHPTGFIGIAVHNQDPMMLTEYDASAAFGGFPGANVDRSLLGVDVSDTDFENYFNDRIDLVTPAAIDITSGGSNTNLTLDVSATFYSPYTAANNNYRLGVILSEDDVNGTAAAYDQHNYYSSQSQNLPLDGAGHNWQTEPATIPAANMEYDHVGRALLGGYTGQASSVPATITDGQTINYSFNYTIPATQSRAHMHATAVLIDQYTGEIVNAKEISIATLGLGENETIGMEVFPNPAADVVNVKFEGQGGTYTVTIMDLAGRQVGTATVVANAVGAQTVTLNVNDLATGNYLVTVAKEGASFTQQVVIK